MIIEQQMIKQDRQHFKQHKLTTQMKSLLTTQSLSTLSHDSIFLLFSKKKLFHTYVALLASHLHTLSYFHDQ